MVLTTIKQRREQLRNELIGSTPNRLKYVRLWLALSHVVEDYEKQKQRGETIRLNERADMIAAFRTTEEMLGLEQSIPRRIR